jgi:hypothetical protein
VYNGEDGEGAGDMIASVYDLNSHAADAFARANHTGTQAASTISDFAASVSGNADVSANTSARHTHVNSVALTAVSGTNTGDETDATIKTKLGISTLSGSNTGDETDTSIKTKLGITTLSGSNTGDETTSTIKTKLGISTLSGSNTGDQDLSSLNSHVSSTSNPHSVTYSQVGAAASSHTHAASGVTAGTLGGQVVANATAAATTGTAQVRNIYVGTSDMTAGSTALTTGNLYFMYE